MSKRKLSIEGQGTVFAIANRLQFQFEIESVADTQQQSVNNQALKAKDVLSLVRKYVEEKDIKTISYRTFPKYDHKCTPVKLVGYVTNQLVQVKAKLVDSTMLLSELSPLIQVTGTQFIVDNVNNLQEEAYERAIKNAMIKAEARAKLLGVVLGRVMEYYDLTPGNSYRSMSVTFASLAPENENINPDIPQGEQEITANVSIVFEII